jgi:hypothetical protein
MIPQAASLHSLSRGAYQPGSSSPIVTEHEVGSCSHPWWMCVAITTDRGISSRSGYKSTPAPPLPPLNPEETSKPRRWETTIRTCSVLSQSISIWIERDWGVSISSKSKTFPICINHLRSIWIENNRTSTYRDRWGRGISWAAIDDPRIQGPSKSRGQSWMIVYVYQS